MKKFICIILVLTCLTCLVSCCSRRKNENKVSWPLVELNATYDRYGNMLQQILYNEQTGECFVKEYTWTLRDDKWVCANTHTTVVHAEREDTQYDNDNNSLNVYYKSDLANGPIVLLNNAVVKVSIVEYLTEAGWWEFGYKIKIENKSSKLLTVMFDDVAILGIACKPVFSIEHVESGHTAYINIAWDLDSLKRACIPYLDNIEFMVRVYNNSDWYEPALYGTKVLIKH